MSHICIAADVSIALMLLFCPQCSVLISDFGALGVWPLLSDTVREEGQKRSLETGGVSNEFGINPWAVGEGPESLSWVFKTSLYSSFYPLRFSET